MNMLAYQLEIHNPLVYLFFFMILYPPIMIIIFGIIDWIKDKIKK